MFKHITFTLGICARRAEPPRGARCRTLPTPLLTPGAGATRSVVHSTCLRAALGGLGARFRELVDVGPAVSPGARVGLSLALDLVDGRQANRRPLRHSGVRRVPLGPLSCAVFDAQPASSAWTRSSRPECSTEEAVTTATLRAEDTLVVALSCCTGLADNC